MSNYILSNGNVYNENELMHYGVPGMKWGIRKSEYKSMTKDQRQQHKKTI